MVSFFTRFRNANRRKTSRQPSRRSLRNDTEVMEVRRLLSTFYVAPTGNDANNGLSFNAPFKTIQHGLNVASHPGDSVQVLGGTYHEHLTFAHSGSSTGGYITLSAYSGQKPILNGTGVASSDTGLGNNMVQMVNVSYVKLIGFEIAYDNGIADQDDAFGVRVQGSGTNVQILNNVVHDITGSVSMGVGGAGIHVYGSSRTTAYSNVIISGNQVYNCQPGDSHTESLTVNGNVTNFQITSNVVHDDNNIGIDMIGGEAATFGLAAGALNLPVPQNGICSHNHVYNIHANYGGGFAGGIYVDGARNIVIEGNTSNQNDMGLEVGAENHGYVASGITVQNNLLYSNAQGGVVFGGFDASVGRVQNCHFLNNTVYNCDTKNTGQGALMIAYASNNIVANNIFVASTNNILISSPYSNSNLNNTLTNNLYYGPGGLAAGKFSWNGNANNTPLTFAQYKTVSQQDHNSVFANPLFVNASAVNFRVTSISPVIGKGNATSGWFATLAIDGLTRDTPPDIGVYEFEDNGK